MTRLLVVFFTCLLIPLLPSSAAADTTSPVTVSLPDDLLGEMHVPGIRLVADLEQPYVEEEFLISGNATGRVGANVALRSRSREVRNRDAATLAVASSVNQWGVIVRSRFISSPFQTLFVTTRARPDFGSREAATLCKSSRPLRCLGGNELSSNFFERG